MHTPSQQPAEHKCHDENDQASSAEDCLEPEKESLKPEKWIQCLKRRTKPVQSLKTMFLATNLMTIDNDSDSSSAKEDWSNDNFDIKDFTFNQDDGMKIATPDGDDMNMLTVLQTLLIHFTKTAS